MDEKNSADVPSIDDTEENILDKLVNPDAVKKPKYSWDDNFQRRIVGLILTDNYFIIQAITLVKPEYFINEVHSDIVNVCFSFFEKYYPTIFHCNFTCALAQPRAFIQAPTTFYSATH